MNYSTPMSQEVRETIESRADMYRELSNTFALIVQCYVQTTPGTARSPMADVLAHVVQHSPRLADDAREIFQDIYRLTGLTPASWCIDCLIAMGVLSDKHPQILADLREYRKRL